MFKTYLITLSLLVGSMSVLASDVNAPAASSADAGAVSNTKKVQATPRHDEAGHDHTKHAHNKENKVKSKSKSKSQQSEEVHDHSKHDHKNQVKMPIVKTKPTDKEYPIGVVKWPEFKD